MHFDPIYLAVYFVAALFTWYCFSMLARRLGYENDSLLGILMAIPGINVIVLLYLALNESPNERQLHAFTKEDLSELMEADAQRQRDMNPQKCPACGGDVSAEAIACPSCRIRLK